MSAPRPPEFRRRAVDLARSGAKPIAALAKELSTSESCLRNWMAQPTPTRPAPPIVSRHRGRERQELGVENEILKRATAYLARENVLPQ